MDKKLLPEGLVLDAITAEPPRDPSHGDIATNAAMVLAKPAQMNPRDVAKLIAEELEKLEEIQQVDVAGPGFINITLSASMWQKLIPVILQQGIKYGSSSLGENQLLNVEFVSANPTGPMHIGHARGAVFGDALARLLKKAGYNVVQEYYINDAGAQVETLARSAYLRYREALGEKVSIPEGLYPGEYLVPVGQILKEMYQNRLLSMQEEEYLPLVKKVSLEMMMALIRRDLADLGIVHDIFVSERTLHDSGAIESTLAFMKEKGLVYKGVLEPPKGKTPEDWEPREQTLFRATDFGDDIDRPLQKSDGSWTYFAADIAYHADKLKRGFNHMLLELGSDHSGYLKRLKAAVSALSDRKATLEIKFHALVNFMENGVPLKMSKRKGTFTTVRDVIDEVGKDIVRFIMLTRKNDMILDFDLVKVKEQSKDNPVFYVQYAHARAHSILRMAQKECPKAIELASKDTTVVQLLQSEEELNLIKLMAEWPRLVESAALSYEPHRVAFYLQQLAAEFHGLWNKGKDNTLLRFVVPDNVALTAARVLLVQSLAIVIASGLDVFCIQAKEEM
jgi:arginyl-tRNA synthetase